MTLAQMADRAQMLTRSVVYAGKHLQLEYTGPPLEVLQAAPSPRVLVAFAPVDYLPPEEADGWGSRSFSKRGIAHVCVFHRAEDWHQNDAFFEAMRACRAYFGPDIAITTYGFSMGGYGAMLGAPALRAERVIAVSPQSTIDPAVVPFERRYHREWAAMDGWMHDLDATVQGDMAEYIVLYDPLHNLDRRHEARLPRPARYVRCPLHGAGHAGIQTLREMGIQEVLFDMMTGKADAAELRHAWRQNRATSFRYLRKVGTRLHERKHPLARHFYGLAKAEGFRRLLKKWRPYYA